MTDQPHASLHRSLILVVDDQETIRLAVSAALERDGFRVLAVADAGAALAAIASDGPGLAILDIGLGGADGLTLLREIRRTGDLPVILLTARDQEVDRVVGLEMGADDYVVKPFSPRELVARVRGLLRRAHRGLRQASVTEEAPGASSPPPAQRGDGSTRLRFDRLVIDTAERQVLLDGLPVVTTRREFDLLLCLAGSPRRVFTREQLLRAAWGSSSEWQVPSTVTEHVRRLRLKLEGDPAHPRWLETVRGVGYRFVP